MPGVEAFLIIASKDCVLFSLALHNGKSTQLVRQCTDPDMGACVIGHPGIAYSPQSQAAEV